MLNVTKPKWKRNNARTQHIREREKNEKKKVVCDRKENAENFISLRYTIYVHKFHFHSPDNIHSNCLRLQFESFFFSPPLNFFSSLLLSFVCLFVLCKICIFFATDIPNGIYETITKTENGTKFK